MRFRVRTLLIAGTLGPPLFAMAWWADMWPIAVAIYIYMILAFLLCT
jgi:hypothetical protein